MREIEVRCSRCSGAPMSVDEGGGTAEEIDAATVAVMIPHRCASCGTVVVLRILTSKEELEAAFRRDAGGR